MNQVFSLILTVYCTKAMVHRIEQHPEYKTKIQDDPIALLEAIKTLVHDPIRAHYPIISAYTAQKLWYTTKQHDKERLNDFAKGGPRQELHWKGPV